MKYLIKKRPTDSQIKSWIELEKEIRPTRAHIWVESKNNTMCNMYAGNATPFESDRWEVVETNQPMVCRICLKNKEKKGIEGVKDNTQKDI